MLYRREESEYYRAKLKAARQIYKGWVKPADLPSNSEIRDQVQSFARMYEGERRDEDLRDMRIEALRLMRLLARFRPRLIGSVLTGHVRKGSDIDLNVFSDSHQAVAILLEDEGVLLEIERKMVRKQGEERVYTHIHIKDRFPIEITVYPSNMAHDVQKCSITGKAIQRAGIAGLEQLFARDYPELDLDKAVAETADKIDRFLVYEALLLPLERVKQSRRYHPEGEALYHSLQVFDLACDELPYDEEFLLAALLHDVGKAIEPKDHIAAGLEALGETITERTGWLIAHHMEAHAVLDGTIGYRARRRLKRNESYDELLVLSRCDRAGRKSGVPTPEVEEALDYVRELATTWT